MTTHLLPNTHVLYTNVLLRSGRPYRKYRFKLSSALGQRQMWTEALQAHFLRPERPAFGPTGLRGCTDGKLHCPWDNSRPSSEILPSHTQDNYSHLPNRQITVTAELHLQKNPLTVCAARLPHQLEAIVECTLKSKKKKIALPNAKEKRKRQRALQNSNGVQH